MSNITAIGLSFNFEKHLENLVRSEQSVRLEKWAKYKTSEKFVELTANLQKFSYYVSSDGSEVTDLNNQVWPLEEFLRVLITLTRATVNKSKHESWKEFCQSSPCQKPKLKLINKRG